VIDRPGNWGAIYDKVIDDARRKVDLTVLQQKCNESSYLLANHVLIDEAIALGAQLECSVCALSVWEGEARGPGDLTAEFRSYATIKNVPLLKDILTIAIRENS
jgi:hypothetical protein